MRKTDKERQAKRRARLKAEGCVEIHLPLQPTMARRIEDIAKRDKLTRSELILRILEGSLMSPSLITKEVQALMDAEKVNIHDASRAFADKYNIDPGEIVAIVAKELRRIRDSSK